MKIKLSAPILDYEDKPIMPEGDSQPLTFFDVFVNSLNSATRGEVLTAEKKNMIYQLTIKMYKEKNKEPNFTVEQLNLIKERVGMSYAPIVLGRVTDLIDGVDEPKADADKAVETPAETPATN